MIVSLISIISTIGFVLNQRLKTKILLSWSPWDASPGIILFLLLVSPKDSGVIFILSILKLSFLSGEFSSIIIWVSWVSSLVQSKDWSGVWGGSLSPGIGGFLGVYGRLSGGLSSRVGILD